MVKSRITQNVCLYILCIDDKNKMLFLLSKIGQMVCSKILDKKTK